MFVALVGAPGVALAATGADLVSATSPVTASATSLDAATSAATVACADEQKVSPALLAQAQARLGGEVAVASLADGDAAASSLFPEGHELGLSTTGEARAIVIRVSFPASADGSEEAQVIPTGETDEDLLAAFNGEPNSADTTYPYESVHAYYLRSSYGKLDLKATQVASCTAKHPRSYYETAGSLSELYYEVLATVDDQVDFTQCDANNDGYIDAVYLQFAGKCGRWASAWWPKKDVYTSVPDGMQGTFDGKKVCAGVLINTVESETSRTATTNAAQSVKQTLIHETGHVLGLPDLYSYSNSTKGSGTIDMMDNNIGDQNALFKWLLGWVDANQITYVYTSSDGVDVRRGTGETQHYDASATVDLLPYTTDESWEKTGGFVAVSSNKTILDGNLFCDFHLLVFDRSAANMTVNTSNYVVNLGHGVRAFRVRAGLNEQKSDFAVSNTSGTPGNQLYECLRPIDGDYEGAAELGDFWHLGALLSPSTKPSTNYYGSQEAGYTGITFKVVGETDTSAQVEFSWTAQSEQREFALTASNSASLNGYATFTYTATWAASLKGSEALSVHLMVDGAEVPAVSSYDTLNGKLTVTAQLNPGDVKTSSSAELVIDAGLFDLGVDAQGNQRLSGQMRLPVTVTAAPTIVASGNYGETAVAVSAQSACSDTCVDPQGRAYFFQAATTDAGNVLRLYRASEDCASVTSTDLACSEEYWNASGVSLQAVDLGDGTAFLQVRAPAAYASGDIAGRDMWVEVATGKVLASRAVPAQEDKATFFSLGNGCVGYTSMAADYSQQVTVLTRVGDSVSSRQVALALPSQVEWAEVSGGAGDGYVYAAQHGQRVDGEKGSVVVWRASDVLAAEDGGAAASYASFSVADNNHVLGVAVAGDKVYVACETIDRTAVGTFIDELRVYSMDGELEKSLTVSPYADATVALKVSATGAVAWITNTQSGSPMASGSEQGRVVIYDPTSDSLCELGVLGPAHGAWVGARWLEVDRDLAAYREGNFDDLHQHWSLTSEFKAADPEPEPEPDPTPNPDPDPDPTPEPTPDPQPTPTPDTGDATTTTTATASEKTATKPKTTPETGDTICDLAVLLPVAAALLAAAAAMTRNRSL